MKRAKLQTPEACREVTDFDLEAFRCRLVDMLTRHRDEHFPNLDVRPVTVTRGRKYAKVTAGGSVYCFVEMASGDIFKPADRNRPAKHVRGNIHNVDPIGCCGPYGIVYLR